MASRPLCLGIGHSLGVHDQILIIIWNLRVSYYGMPSLTRGRVCNLLVQVLLGLVSAVSGSSPVNLLAKSHTFI
jgi:hypothetical protein